MNPPIISYKRHLAAVARLENTVRLLHQALAESEETNIALKKEIAHIKIDHYFTRQESGLKPLYNEPDITREALGTRVSEHVKLTTLPDYIWGFEQHIMGMPKEKQQEAILLVRGLIKLLESGI